PFTLHRPETAEDACALLATLGEDAAPYAGGTELLLLMKLGLLRPPHLVDVKRIAGFGDIADGPSLTIGATVTHRTLERAPLGIAVALRLDGAGERTRVADARVAIGCVSPRPMRAESAETRLNGVAAAELGDVTGVVADAAAESVDPADDLHGSAEYKREMVA